MAPGANVTITPTGNTLTIAASGGGVGGAILNQTTLQSNANFNIDGNGFIGGNVGVGTQSTLAKLNVAGAGYGFLHSTPSVSLGSYIDSTALAGWLGTKSNHPLYLFTNNAAQPQLAVGADGRVGIGTDTPAARLTVSGAGAYNTVGAARIDLFNPVTGPGFLQNVTDTGIWQIATTGGATRMVIDNFGNVGIGTVTPSSHLTISGSGTNGFALGVNGDAGQNVSAGGFVKAMVLVNPFLLPENDIVRCWNSQANLAAVNCGLTVTRIDTGLYYVDFGFSVADRFLSATLVGAGPTISAGGSGNTVQVFVWSQVFSRAEDAAFYLIVY